MSQHGETAFHFLTYGDKPWLWKCRVLCRQAKLMGAASATAGTRKSLRREHLEACAPYIHASRGGGYWLWKPEIIAQRLESIPDGEFLIYADAGCEISMAAAPQLKYYFDILKDKSVLALLMADQHNHQWTNGAVIHYFGAEGQPWIRSPQAQSGLLFIRKCPESTALIRKWLETAQQRPSLFSDENSKVTSRQDFIEHRHDQSVLNMLMRADASAVLRDYRGLVTSGRPKGDRATHCLLTRVWEHCCSCTDA